MGYDIAYTEMIWHGQMKHFHHIFRHALAPLLGDFNTGTESGNNLLPDLTTWH